MLYLILSRTDITRSFRLIVQLHRLNPHWEMDKTFSPSYSPSQITYVEAVGFSPFCFRFHRKRTGFITSASSFRFRFHIPVANISEPEIERLHMRKSRVQQHLLQLHQIYALKCNDLSRKQESCKAEFKICQKNLFQYLKWWQEHFPRHFEICVHDNHRFLLNDTM